MSEKMHNEFINSEEGCVMLPVGEEIQALDELRIRGSNSDSWHSAVGLVGTKITPTSPFEFRRKIENSAEGRKDDGGKLRYDLLPWKQVEEIVKVMSFGAKKYAPDNWKLVKDSRSRYFAAACRHLFAWWTGEKNDPESGLNHLAHVGCCVLFLLHFDSEAK